MCIGLFKCEKDKGLCIEEERNRWTPQGPDAAVVRSSDSVRRRIKLLLIDKSLTLCVANQGSFTLLLSSTLPAMKKLDLHSNM